MNDLDTEVCLYLAGLNSRMNNWLEKTYAQNGDVTFDLIETPELFKAQFIGQRLHALL